jgi:hypothetical protein
MKTEHKIFQLFNSWVGGSSSADQIRPLNTGGFSSYDDAVRGIEKILEKDKADNFRNFDKYCVLEVFTQD